MTASDDTYDGREGRAKGGRSTPDPIDLHVGGRIRIRRTLLGMTQEALARKLGLTFQQIQKYERGANRIGAARLYRLGCVLDVPMSFFFDDMAGEARPAGDGPTEGERVGFETQTLGRRETLELARAYYRIGDPIKRRRLVELVRAIAGSAAGEQDAAAESP